MSEENVEIVRRGYEAFHEAFERGDRSALYAWFEEVAAPEFEYVPTGRFVGVPLNSMGIDGFMQFLDTFWQEFEETSAEPRELIDAGNSVIACVNFHGKGKHSGAEVELEAFQVWTFKHGKAIRGQGVWSKDEAFKAAGLSE